MVLLLGTILTIILLGVVVGLVMRCSDPSHHHHHQLSRGSDNGFETLQVEKNILKKKNTNKTDQALIIEFLALMLESDILKLVVLEKRCTF